MEINELKERQSFTFFRSFFDAIEDLSPKNRSIMYRNIIYFSFNGELPDVISGKNKTIWKLIEPIIDKSLKQFYNGKNPKQKISQTEAKRKPNTSQTEANPSEELDKEEDKEEEVDLIKENISLTGNSSIKKKSKIVGGKTSIPKDKEDVRHIHGEFKHVLLSNNEKRKMLTIMDKEECLLWVKKLDEYIERTGRKDYKNHYLTIRTWRNNETENNIPKAKPIVLGGDGSDLE